MFKRELPLREQRPLAATTASKLLAPMSLRAAPHVSRDHLLARAACSFRSACDGNIIGVWPAAAVNVDVQPDVEGQLAAHDHVLFATVVHVRVVAIDAVADVIARDDLPGLMFSTEERHVFARDGPMTFVCGPGRGLESAGAQIRRSEVKHREQTCR